PPNNCQTWCQYVLEAGNCWTANVQTFVKQDVTEIAKQLPEYAKKIMNVVTDLGAISNHVLGKGMVIHAIKIKKGSMTPKEMKHHAENIAKRKNMKTKEITNHIMFRVIPRTKFDPSSYRTKKVMKGNVSIIFGQLK
ncbi:hypothetical protein, partial [Clostridium sp.]|uniref:hypothetical protein n=1 Tax=Clostridium sp. TaxID=1506 RepID=UPI002840FCF4